MTGASLGYSGTYVDVLLYSIGDSARWHSSTIETTYATHFLSIRGERLCSSMEGRMNA